MEEEKVKTEYGQEYADVVKNYVSRHRPQTASSHFKGREQAMAQSPTTPQPELTEPPQPTVLTVPSDPLRRVSAKQRKVSLDEYREQFMIAPKIADRQPVFVSRTTRDRIDEIVRRFGERKMSVSGFLENIAHHHLTLYNEDIEQWKRL